MKKWHILLMFIACWTAASAADDSQRVDSLLHYYSSKLAEHNYFSAPFTQSRYLSMFKKPLVSTGTISFSHPDKILFHYKKPFESMVLFSEGSMKRFRIENGKPVEQPSLEVVAKAITKEILRYMSGNFVEDFPYHVTVTDEQNHQFRLTPKMAAARAIFASIDLTFPESGEYVKSVRLNEPTGDYILIEHDQPSFSPLDSSVFVIQP